MVGWTFLICPDIASERRWLLGAQLLIYVRGLFIRNWHVSLAVSLLVLMPGIAAFLSSL